MMFKAWWPAVTGLPLGVCIAVFWLVEGLGDWTALPRPVIAGAFADALLANAFISLVAAPLLGVAVARRVTTSAGIVRELSAMVLGFAGVSTILSIAASGLSPVAIGTTLTSHLAMAAGAMALGTLGALCGRLFRNPLDGAGVSIAAGLFLGTGILLAGPSVTDVPRPLIDGALLASPLVTTAAAAHIDILRTDLLYQVSPLAHVGTDYSEWYVGTAVYFMFSAACLTGTGLVNRFSTRRPSVHSKELSLS